MYGSILEERNGISFAEEYPFSLRGRDPKAVRGELTGEGDNRGRKQPQVSFGVSLLLHLIHILLISLSFWFVLHRSSVWVGLHVEFH